MILPPNRSAPDREKHYLTQRGFTAQMQANLHLDWSSQRFNHLLTADGRKLQDLGYRPAAVFDADDHYLGWQTAQFFYRLGQSAHVAYLLQTDNRPVINLHHTPTIGNGSPFQTLPFTYAFQILFVAKRPKDLAWYQQRYRHAAAGTPMPGTSTIQTVAALEAEVDLFFGMAPQDESFCCP